MPTKRQPITVPSSPSTLAQRNSDRVLLARWVAGDRHAGDQLLCRYEGPLQRYFGRAAPVQDPAELTQETLTQLCISAASALESKAKFRSYVFGIARNVLNQHLRRVYRQRDFDSKLHGFPSVDEQTPAATFGVVCEQAAVLEALALLSVEQRALLQAFYWDGRTADQLGLELGIPAATVRTRLFHSKRRLRDLLDEGDIGGVELEVLVQRLRGLLSQGPCATEAVH